MSIRDAFIVDGVRSPIGTLGGGLASVRADDLAAAVIRALLDRHADLDPANVGDVLLGCANQAGEDNRNVARMALLLAGMPWSVPGETFNRLCASGLAASAYAVRSIRLGIAEFYIAGGVEHMTRAPYVLSKAEAPFGRDMQLYDTTLGWRFVNPRLKERFGTDSMGQTAENVAELLGIGRADQDGFAAESQRKAAAARERGRFAQEIVPIQTPPARRGASPGCFEHDEFIRPDTTPEILAGLKPAFRHDGKGSVTAGNSSGLNDGACALLVASDRALKEHGMRPLVRVLGTSAVGVEPRLMGLGPVPATHAILARHHLRLKDMDVIEINEAFAAQVLGCLRQLGIADDDPRVNPNGGAIALGHPLGMSGARLLLTAAHQLRESGGRYALCTMCVGVGQGMAAIIENVPHRSAQ